MKFDILIQQIEKTHENLQSFAANAINVSLTIRNYLFGFYIVEFEQNGEDRAAYGEQLLEKIAERIKHIKGLSYRNLNMFRQFYLAYPKILQSLIAESDDKQTKILQSLIAESLTLIKSNYKSFPQINTDTEIWQSPIAKFERAENQYGVNSETLVSRLSYTHLIQLIVIDDPIKRAFYEIQAIKGNWNVRELKRQINTLFFERTGMSANMEKMLDYVQQNAQQVTTKDIIQQPYVFDFMGFKDKDMVLENDLEQALLNHLHEFIMELGTGFCLEARQKRITIGKEYNYIDLVFYHRILKCHVLLELKVDEFKSDHAAQLRTYLRFYNKNFREPNDNPPIGILLCTNKDNTLVEYAVDENADNIFVRQYLLNLPTKEQLIQLIDNEKLNFEIK